METLGGVLAIAFCWAWHVGAWQHEVKPIALKTHQRPAKSLFRYGFDGILHEFERPAAACRGSILRRFDSSSDATSVIPGQLVFTSAFVFFQCCFAHRNSSDKTPLVQTLSTWLGL